MNGQVLAGIEQRHAALHGDPLDEELFPDAAASSPSPPAAPNATATPRRYTRTSAEQRHPTCPACAAREEDATRRRKAEAKPPPPAALTQRRRRRNRRSRVRGEGDGEGDGMETPSTRWTAARSSARRYGAPVREYSLQMGSEAKN